MTVTELAELLLLRIYDTAMKKGFNEEVSLSQLAKDFGEEDEAKIIQIGKSLESRNLIVGLFRKGDTSALLTGNGALFVEKDGETGIIVKYKENPSTFINIEKFTNIHDINNSNISANSSDSNQKISILNEWENILNKMNETINKDNSLEQEEKQDIIADCETLKLQMNKKSRNKELINSILNKLGNFTSIASFVVQLSQMI